MSLRTLTPPQDITWNRLAYSRDMIDTNFGDLKFPSKWRSSLSVYYFIVPEEETADAYPNSRIVYLRLTSSITGWNPNEELRNAKKTAGIGDSADDVQKSIWETVISDGWANAYEPCLGAIMQIAVYPPKSSNTEIDDYPEIMDFEPKKRELYESVTAGSEILSESSEVTSIGKSSSHTVSVNATARAGIPIIGGEVSAGYKYQLNYDKNTDTSREDRETKSYTTSFSQMYQLFNGYHIGTNRAVFVIAPRPHTLSKVENKEDHTTEFNLINGQRALEGIQDVFLIINLSKKLNGFCVQASIDTGHTIMKNYMMAREWEDNQLPNGGEEPNDNPNTPQPQPQPQQDGEVYHELVVTRRIVQNCGKFDDNGNFVITGVPDLRPPGGGVIVWEDSLPTVSTASAIVGGSSGPMRITKAELVNQLNIRQRRVMKSMISGFSAGNFEPVEIMKSKTFKRRTRESIQNLNIPLSKLVELNYLSRTEADFLSRSRITNIGDIFKDNLGQSDNPDIRKLRRKILEKTGVRARDNT